MAKAKVVPIRAVTIPRLELQAAVLAVKIARFLEKELGHLEAQHYLWTDSRVVLGYIYNQTKKFYVFVANHLLTLKPEPIFPPPGTFQKEDKYSRKRWRRVQYLVEQFWTRWKKEYLPTLQPRRKWFHQKDAVQPGMVVLLIEDGAPRGTWRMARVEKTYPGGDGLIRSVQLRVSTSVKTTKGLPKVQTSFIDRPIHKLVPLHLKDTE
ncbi:hypothetical protein V1264_020702 [Littorina saxatilis]|uniref:DUF5641 domain-containing protein n=1 Tax=Littorina saxatilis TaxID=31220 RepID=A0AAN9BAN2_9CAEN